MSSSRFCLNRECPELNLDHYRPGWRLRTGDFADLCDRCGSAYDQGNFCEVFHQRASGWRCCESCGKRIHCGCIVSASAFVLLDAGGIECLSCARKKVALGPNFLPSPSFLFKSPTAEKIRDSSINWSSSTGSTQISRRHPSLLGPSVLQFGLHNCGDIDEFDQLSSRDRATAYSTEEKRGMNDLMGKLMSENSKNHTNYIRNNQKTGPHFNVPPCPNANVYHPLLSLKGSPCGAQLSFPVPITTPIETNCHSRLDGINLRNTPNSSPLIHSHNDLNGGADSSVGSKSQRTHTPGQYQVVPRYWPKVSYNNQAQQSLSKESESVVTPLFEKMLSASDTGRVGRLVLPKKCAEAFLPQISHPEGVPLKVQDSMGKEWTFQFRFWPNNNSRMYVLEGVTPCIQSMQLQAGDTVIFSRLDPEKKLIMGFRKASVAQSSVQEIDLTNNDHDSCTNGDADPIDTHSSLKEKKTPGGDFSSGKTKSRMMVTRSKRRKVKNGDVFELKVTWEEAQGCILPPPNFTPSIVVIDEIEFEEYEEAPIIGRPLCSTNQELRVEQHDEEEAMKEVEGLSMPSKETTKHPRHRDGCTCIVCIQSPSGKGPKHDQSCSCTVCDTKKRRRHSQLLRREKKQLQKEVNAHKEMMESLDSDEQFHQSGNTSTNHEHHGSSLKVQIDLNVQPDEESLPSSNTTTKNKSPHDHDDSVKSSFKQPSSSSAHSQIKKEDE